MKVIDEDFVRLKYNVYKHRDEANVMEAFPKLNIWFRELKEKCPPEIDFNKLIIYTVLLGDCNSPTQTIDNMLMKRKECASIAGFPEKEQYQNIIKANSPYALQVFVLFCKLVNDFDYSELILYLDLYYKEYSNALNEEDATKRNTSLKILESTKQKILELQNKILNRENAKSVSDELYEQITDEKVAELSPEYIAERLSKGELPFIELKELSTTKKKKK